MDNKDESGKVREKRYDFLKERLKKERWNKV